MTLEVSNQRGLTGTRSPTRSGSKTWSARSLTGRESSVERKDLVKASSDMIGKATVLESPLGNEQAFAAWTEWLECLICLAAVPHAAWW